MGDAALWEEIELSESYLVCSMYEEAASSSSSILKRMYDNIQAVSKGAIVESQLHDMLTSAGMVFVQSLHGLGRTEEIVNELRDAFGAVATIPAQVLLTGICLQIASSSHSGIREMLEEFLSKWVYEDGHYILNDADASTSFVKGFDGKIFLDVNDYMEVVELYTLTVLGKISEDVDLAISWLEKAALPEERRQELSRRLHSLLSLKTTNISQGSPLLQAKQEASSFVEDPVASKESCDAENKKRLPNEGKNDIYTLLKLSKQHKPSLWSSRPLNLNLGNTQLTISKGKITITLVVFIICYALRRKRVALMRALGRKMGSMKKALLDFWQLAFSYQVNPLAAVQPLPNRRT